MVGEGSDGEREDWDVEWRMKKLVWRLHEQKKKNQKASNTQQKSSQLSQQHIMRRRSASSFSCLDASLRSSSSSLLRMRIYRKCKENPTHLILSTYLNRKLNFYGCHRFALDALTFTLNMLSCSMSETRVTLCCEPACNENQRRFGGSYSVVVVAVRCDLRP